MCGSNSVAECQLPKLNVAGSIPVSRSNPLFRLGCAAGLAAVLCARALHAAGEPPNFIFDTNGLAEIRLGDRSFRAPCAPSVISVRLADQYRNKNDEEKEKQLEIPAERDPYAGDFRVFRDGATNVISRTFDLSKRRWRLNFEWGNVEISLVPDGSTLKTLVSVSNSGREVLEKIAIRLLSLESSKFNLRTQVATTQPDWARDDANIGAPLILKLADEEMSVIVYSPDPGGPLRYVWQKGSGDTADLVVTIGTGEPDGEVYDGVWNVRPVRPGQDTKFDLSLVFTGSDADPFRIAAEANGNFARLHPFALLWPDRRPIAAIHLADNRTSEANPRGWKHGAGVPETWDIRREGAREEFRRCITNAAHNVLSLARKAGFQGVIVWQIEGQEFSKVAYYGEPRLIPWIAPEMDEVADDYFRILRDGGLRVGVCIRPPLYEPLGADSQRVDWAEVKEIRGVDWTHPSQKNVFHDSRDTIFDVREAQSPLERLDAKIRYAKKRWGCTLFYIDTNHFWRPRDRSRDGWAWSSRMVPAEVFEELHRRHPDVLLVPEHEYLQYWSATAPYLQPPSWGICTGPDVRAVYPAAFSVICSSPGSEWIQKDKAGYLEAVRNGDIFMANGWYGCDDVREFYQEAARSAPIRARCASDGRMVIERVGGHGVGTVAGKDAAAPAAVSKLVREMLTGRQAVRDRLVWIVYENGMSLARVRELADAIGEGGGIVIWASEVGGGTMPQ